MTYLYPAKSFGGMDWLCLFFAGVFEIGWPIGFKMAGCSSNKIAWIVFAVAAMAVSGLLLFAAQRTIPIGTAYAVWTSIGTAGTFIVGVLAFGEPSGLMRVLAVAVILIGVAMLKLSE